jgi:ankyrin repeat protein/pyrimidine deaminase RibD-like protein
MSATISRRRTLVALLACGAWSVAGARSQGLIEAAARGDAKEVQRLLAGGAAVEARDASGRTALLAATQGNHEAAARLLIEAGADVNAQDNQRDSPFLLAGARGYLGILRMTLAAGADLKSTNRYGGTALIPACHYGHVDTVRELLHTKIDVDHLNNLGWTALLEAVILGDGGPRHTEIVRLLLSANADPGIADGQGVTPLGHARQRNFVEMVRLIEAASRTRALKRAQEMRQRAVASGDQPYGAVVVCDGKVVGEAPSRVVAKGDAAAHAEREALADAKRRLGTARLERCELVSTSRPCPACEAAARKARIARMFHG